MVRKHYMVGCKNGSESIRDSETSEMIDEEKSSKSFQNTSISKN